MIIKMTQPIWNETVFEPVSLAHVHEPWEFSTVNELENKMSTVGSFIMIRIQAGILVLA